MSDGERKVPRWALVGALVVALLIAGNLIYAAGSPDPNLATGRCSAPGDGESVARLWNDKALDAIRRDEPAPTVHARNLYHLSAAMWDAWASFDNEAPALFAEFPQQAADIEAARVDAVSFAAAHLLTHRYRSAEGRADTMAALDNTMMRLCGMTVAEAVATVTHPEAEPSAAAWGLAVADTIIEATYDDGSDERLGYEDLEYEPVNPPLDLDADEVEVVDANRWQPLDLDVAVAQNGLPLPGGEQRFIGSQWGSVAGFGLPPAAAGGLPIDPGPPPLLGPDTVEFHEAIVEVIRLSAELEVGVAAVDGSPSVVVNPVTGEPYAENAVDRADHARVIAEYWADGPDSETPPGHWNVIANEASDALAAAGPLRIGAAGESLDRLQWDIKLYLVLNGALHDAAVAAWGTKAHYDYVRPITMVRYLGGLGQSSDPALGSFDAMGLPLVDGLIELVTDETSGPGGRHADLADHVGEVAVRSWRGAPDDPDTEIAGVGWILAADWVPYQRPTFVTPSFAGYVSGHSAFSRAGAEILAAFTGSAAFPGGLSEHRVEPGDLIHEAGPSAPVTLQWGTYREAADQAGRSRLHGGIHVVADDLAGRELGARCAELAWARAGELFALP